MKNRLTILALCCLAAACADFPRDSAGTLDDVRDQRFTVGWSDPPPADPRLQALARAIAARTESRPSFVSAPAETLLAQLEQGEIDLVLGTFDRKSPWSTRVTFSKPVFSEGKSLEGKAALRNGEHAWAMAVDRAVQAVRREGRP